MIIVGLLLIDTKKQRKIYVHGIAIEETDIFYKDS